MASSENKQQCPFCKRWFKRLGAHKCKEKSKIQEEKGYAPTVPDWMSDNDIDPEDMVWLVKNAIKDLEDIEQWRFMRMVNARLSNEMAVLIHRGLDWSQA